MDNSRIEKDKAQILSEISDVRAATEEVSRSKASADKSHKHHLTILNDLNKKIDESHLTIGDMEASKRRLTAENADILRQLQELEASANLMIRLKSSLVNQLEEQKRIAEDEARERLALLGKYRNLEHEVDGLKENLQEETVSRENLKRQLDKAGGLLSLFDHMM